MPAAETMVTAVVPAHPIVTDVPADFRPPRVLVASIGGGPEDAGVERIEGRFSGRIQAGWRPLITSRSLPRAVWRRRLMVPIGLANCSDISFREDPSK